MSTTAPEEVKPKFVADPKKHAFATWVVGDLAEKYILGALVLGNTLKQYSAASRVVMISSNVSEASKALLATVFTEIVEVPVIDVQIPLNGAKFDASEKDIFAHIAFTKLNAWNLTQFDKVALLDADCVVLNEDCDNIFEVQAPAVYCGGIKNCNTNHGKLVEMKVWDKCFKEATAFNGSTILLKPSKADFDRMIKTLAKKIAKAATISQDKKGPSLKQVAKKTSAFSILDLDDDEDDEEEEFQEEEKESKKPQYLTKEELEMAKFGDEKANKKEYAYKVYTNDEVAPLGFVYGFEGKKSAMSQDDKFLQQFYQKQWKHLQNGFALLSWKYGKLKAPQRPIILHFTKRVWELSEEEAEKWVDVGYFDLALVDLYDAATTDAKVKAFLEEQIPSIKTKSAAKASGELKAPEIITKEQLAAQAAANEMLPAVVVQQQQAAAAANTTTTATTTAQKPKVQQPAKPAWGKAQ